MDDNKRLLLALLISVGIFLAYSLLTPSQKTQPPVASTTTTAAPAVASHAEKTKEPPSTSPGALKQEASAASQAGESAKGYSPVVSKAGDVVVETPLFRAWFSKRGAALRKVILKKYYEKPEKKGGNFVLLDLKRNEPYTLGVNLPDIDPALERRLFSADVDKLVVAPGSRGKRLTFTSRVGDLQVEKTYVFSPEGYHFNLEVKITNSGQRELEIHPEISLSEQSDKKKINSYAFTGVEIWLDEKLSEMSSSDLEDKPVESGAVGWMGMNIPYFMAAVVPLSGNSAEKRSVRGALKDGVMIGTLVEPLLTLPAGQSKTLRFMVYYGPRDLRILEKLGHKLDRAVDFGWFDIIAKPMLTVLQFLDKYIGNYGVAIIIVTLLVKLLFWPLTQKSYKSMKEMQKLQPQIAKLREKYKGDKQRMNQEVMQMYKTYKVNPMGGCLPMVVQIPVFLAFYKVLGMSIELRHAPFMLWMNDLSAPDRLPIGIDIPYVGHGLPVLTLLMGASMFIQQKMTPTTGDPTQAKMMMLMPVVFTVMFINFPSGLVLYWLVNNLLGIGQQYWTNKKK